MTAKDAFQAGVAMAHSKRLPRYTKAELFAEARKIEFEHGHINAVAFCRGARLRAYNAYSTNPPISF